MKRIIFALALAAVPGFALAQQSPTPSPPMGGPSHHMSDADRAQMQQMMQMHQQYRTDVLNALTPAHRQLLASVVGSLAVSTTPDEKAAVAKLDAALSDGEKTAILAATSKMHDQLKAMMSSMHHSTWSPQPGKSPKPARSPGSGMMHDMNDPGQILLMVSSMYGDHLGMMMRGMHQPPHS
jgi:hypothetical protein